VPEQKLSKDETIRRIVRMYLTSPAIRPKQIQNALGLEKRETFRYLSEIRERLRPVDDVLGAATYVPSEDEVEMAVLMLKRAIEEGQVTDEMVDLARQVIQRAESA
jgi:hypothetical protein